MEEKSIINEKKPLKKSPIHKIILVGEKSSGKTSIFSMIFTHVYPIETICFESTRSISLNQIIFSGGELIELDDCGFEVSNKDSNDYYLKGNIFEDVSTLILVINAEEQINLNLNNISNKINENNQNNSNICNNNNESLIKINKDLLLEECIKLLNENSPNANIFILIHKMDKILLNKKKFIFEDKKREILDKIGSFHSNIKFFPTSIWDGSLYTPWREIMSNMVINKDILINGLKFLLEACDADEIFLFERNTFLCICSVDNGINKNREERTKKISFLIKKLKQALNKNKSNFSCLKLKLNNIMVYFEEFSKYSYIMILNQKPKINYECLYLNICILRENFEKYFNCKLLN